MRTAPQHCEMRAKGRPAPSEHRLSGHLVAAWLFAPVTRLGKEGIAFLATSPRKVTWVASGVCLLGQAANNLAVCPGLLPGGWYQVLLLSCKTDPHMPQEEASLWLQKAHRCQGFRKKQMSRCHGDGGSCLLAACAALLHRRLWRRHSQQVKHCNKYTLLLP